VEASGQIRVADALQQAVLRVDPSSGARTLLVGAGGGCGFFMAQGIVVTASGQVLVTDPAQLFNQDLDFSQVLGCIVRVDPISGNRTEIASGFIPRGIALEADGQVLVTATQVRRFPMPGEPFPVFLGFNPTATLT
jgi:sugar lactone lactonase YvrE